MRHFNFSIPAGAAAHPVSDSLGVPVEVDVLAILPHAHSLGRTLRAHATLPDGGTQPLLDIPRWDPGWQGDYRYAKPVRLPAGSVIHLDYTYDNSTNNPANPHQPPVPVGYGLQADDEMAELWLLVQPRGPEGAATLRQSRAPRILRETIGYHRHLLTLNPRDARALSEIGKAHVLLDEHSAAEPVLRAALQADPALADPHYWLGLSLRQHNRLTEARTEFAIATRLNPGWARAWGNLGLVLLDQGDKTAARAAFSRALALDPSDRLAKAYLEESGPGR
jgi:tetratricopeptide (TPR) repeat protein